jgi:hypothetical protein
MTGGVHGCNTYGVIGEVVNGAHTSIGIAFADNKPINNAVEEAKKAEPKVHHRQHSRSLVTASWSRISGL